MRAVNLIPRDGREEKRRGDRLPLLIAVGVLVALMAGMAVVYRSATATVEARSADLELTEAVLARLPAPEQPSAAGGMTQERTNRFAALTAAMATRIPLDRLLRDLSYVLPEDAWLTGMSVSAPTPVDPATAPPGTAPTGTTQGVTIEGATFSHASVSRVLSRLAALPSLTNVRLVTSAKADQATAAAAPGAQTTSAAGKKNKKNKKQQRPKAVVTFTIDASVRTGGGS